MTMTNDQTASGAEAYERSFVPAIARPVATVTLDAARLQRGERVLDVACGTGVVARLAADAVGPDGTVTGVDLAPDMVDFARRLAPAIDWRVGDACDLPLPDESYDAVLCQLGLMFIADRPAAVAEMRRVAAPGGRVVVVTPGRIQPALEVLERAIVDHINADLGGFVRAVFSMDDPDAVAGLLRDAGLRDVAGREATATLQLPPPAEFVWQYINLTPMGPFVAQAPQAARAAMERQAVEQWPPIEPQAIVVATGRR